MNRGKNLRSQGKTWLILLCKYFLIFLSSFDGDRMMDVGEGLKHVLVEVGNSRSPCVLFQSPKKQIYLWSKRLLFQFSTFSVSGKVFQVWNLEWALCGCRRKAWDLGQKCVEGHHWGTYSVGDVEDTILKKLPNHLLPLVTVRLLWTTLVLCRRWSWVN